MSLDKSDRKHILLPQQLPLLKSEHQGTRSPVCNAIEPTESVHGCREVMINTA